MHHTHLANNKSANYFSYIFSSQSVLCPYCSYVQYFVTVKYNFTVLFFAYPYFCLRNCVQATKVVFVPSGMGACAVRKIVNSIVYIKQCISVCWVVGEWD